MIPNSSGPNILAKKTVTRSVAICFIKLPVKSQANPFLTFRKSSSKLTENEFYDINSITKF